jgi:hypothetical protein
MMHSALKAIRADAWGGGGLLSVALALGLFVATAAPGEATPISAYTGSSLLSGTGIDGTVNYAVYTSQDFANDAGSILSSFAAGYSSSSLDLSAGIYVYAFQVANNGSNATAITSVSFGKWSGADVTSWGSFNNGVVFTDPGGLVSATNSLDAGATSVGFSVDSGIKPGLVWNTSTSLQASLNIPSGAASSLIVYTSHYGPDWISTQINGGGFGAAGLVPGADPPRQVPEPRTLILTVIGMVGLGGLSELRQRLRRRGGD